MIENKQAKNKDVHVVIYYLEVDFFMEILCSAKDCNKKDRT